MKIADYGKAITSYIESPTLEQKNKLKTKALLLAERDNFNTPDLEQAPDSYLKPGETLEDFDVTFRKPNSTGGRVQLADGTTPKEKPFTLNEFKDKADIYMAAYAGNALPVNDIRLALDKFTKQGIADGTFTADEAIKVVKDLKSYYQDLSQKQRLRGVVEGIGDVEREELVEGGLLKTGPNKGKYVLRSIIDGERARRFFDTKEEFDEAVKISQANKGGGARDQSKRISKPTNSEIEISEKVYGDKYNKKGEELWKSLTRRERGGIRQGTTTGGKKGPEGLGVTEEGKPVYQVKREKALKRNAPFFQKGTKDFQFHHIMNIGGEIPLDTNDIAVISEKMNRTLAPYNRKLNDIADNISTLFNNQPKDYLKKIDQLNSEGESIIKKAVKDLPKEYRNLIGFNKVVPVTDEYGTVINIASEKIGGSNQKQPGIKLEDLTNKQASALRKQIKSDALKFSKTGVKDKILSGAGKVLKGVGKVVKPIGYAIGTKALFDAQALAKEQGIELSLLDKAMAVDSGDPLVALDNYKRRNVPGYSEEQAGITLSKFQDDFEEVGKNTTFGKYNDQIKNTKLP
jgi:hypothetical protein